MKALSFKKLKKIAKKYNVELIMEKDCGWTNGGSSAGNIISIYPCKKKWMMEISFWHELGHILATRTHLRAGKTHSLSKLSNEGNAWETGLTEAAKYNRFWDYSDKEMEWARECLASYVKGEYDDLPYKKVAERLL
jgi:hypothetical protein